MNWDNLFKYLYKCFLISYLILWSMELNNHQQKHLTLLKDTLFTIQTTYLGMEPTFLTITKSVIGFYAHFLAVVAVTILFSWSIYRPLTILCLLINFLLLSTKKQMMFIAVDVIMIAVVLQVNLKNLNNPKEKTS